MDKTLHQKIDSFFGKYKTLNFAKREMILAPKQPVTGIYFLKKGLVRMYLRTGKGRMLVIHIFRPESFF